MKKSFLFMMLILGGLFLFSACEKDDPSPPVVEVYGEPSADDPYTYTFSTQAQNVTSYSWDFGDGETGSGSSATHTYEESGKYTVKVTVEGEGGEASASLDITIAASMEEMLTGGAANPDGKTWVMSKSATSGQDGAGQIKTHFPHDIMPFPDNVLGELGIEAEYDNEYTFVHDGSYSVDNKNGNVLAGWLYSFGVLGEEAIVSITDYGIFVVNHEESSDASWSLHHGDLVMDVANEDGEQNVTEETITFEDADYITFEEGGFIGILDFSRTAIIRELTPDKMVLAFFLHSVEDHPDKPSTAITMTFVPK